MVIYSDRLLPTRFGAFTYGPLIVIRPRLKDDVGLLEHEKTHVAQFKRNWLQPVLYVMSKKYRMRYEAEAFRVQLKHSPGKAMVLAGMLATKYGLGITTEQALAAIIEGAE